MRKPIVICLTIVFAVSMLLTPVMAKKVGEVKDGVFTDNDHNYSMKVPDGWSVKIGSKSKVPLRLTLMEKSPTLPRVFLGENEDYAQIPTIKFMVDTCSLNVDEFIKNLTNPDFKSEQKKFFLKHFKLLSRDHEILTSTEVTFHDDKAVMMSLRQPYSIQISARGSNRATAHDDFYSSNMFFTVRDGKIFAMYFICEYQSSAHYEKLWPELINSIKFTEAGK